MANTLPRSLDVVVNVTKAQTAVAYDMTLACLLSTAVDFDQLNRFRMYSDFASFEDDIPSNKTAWWAGDAFFAQKPRPATFAVGKVYTASQPAIVVGGQGIDLSALASVTAGSMVITVGTTATTLTALDFHSCTTLAQVATAIGSLASVNGTGIIMSSASSGSAKLSAFATAHTSGTDVSALLKLTVDTAEGKADGYDYVSLEDEANRVQDAALAAGRKVYGWTLDSNLRVKADQETFAAWVAAQERCICGLCDNTASTKSGGTTNDLASALKTSGNDAAFVVYHDNVQSFPDVSYMAYLLATDYNATNSAIDMKFKDLVGIDTVPVTETELSVLLAKRANVLTDTRGNRVTRDGTQSAVGWQSSTRVDIDNFVEELQTEVFSIFLKNKKVPYTFGGQMLLVSAANKIANKYVRNGVFADRILEDKSQDNGSTVAPAVKVVPLPIESATDAMRSDHIGPPIQIVAYLSGAIHKVTVNVSVEE